MCISQKRKEKKRKNTETLFNYLIITKYVNNIDWELLFFLFCFKIGKEIGWNEEEVTPSVHIL